METSIYSVIAFYLLAITIVGNAALVVFAKNIVHSVLFLAVTFISMAGLFLLLDADFIAAIQVLVYAGAVCIMVVFGIMLIQAPDMKGTNLFNTQLFAGGGVVALVFAMCAILAGRTAWTDLVATQAVPENTIQVIGTLLMSKYVIPFEVVAILLLVALVGAIVIARDDAGTVAVDEGVKANAHD
ncbi:NADH-quinone oxidoreductase subunit J [Sporotomaculum syntrophicum]|uniref:NADH-quinone oxidoreductase subunit J n=1 Tax=Sporotomaculum syntrophicum TaxID=182264 RepID=A0A9D2WSH7_9FIRM|nr:NADH-quinone oxidoreductase subunit J [Sporotomaculum syntrophicum]KAF1086634.1 NADH-quinone oxidoreductase subunit J [Sporotomaculum syntrophicum]